MCGSQVVGLVPLEAMLKAAQYYIDKENLFILEEDQKIRLVSLCLHIDYEHFLCMCIEFLAADFVNIYSLLNFRQLKGWDFRQLDILIPKPEL